MAAEIGKKAPNFRLSATGGAEISRNGLKGKTAVLYFYPKDDTPGCTQEACDFRDNMKQLTHAGAVVIGVSKDNLKSHDKFAKKYDLNFTLASDEDGKVCEAFDVWVEKSMYGRKYMGIERATFLIDEEGFIRKIWRKVKVGGHVQEILAELESAGT